MPSTQRGNRMPVNTSQLWTPVVERLDSRRGIPYWEPGRKNAVRSTSSMAAVITGIKIKMILHSLGNTGSP